MTSSTLVSLLDMLEIDAKAFMDAVMEVRRVQAVVDHEGVEANKKLPLPETLRPMVRGDLKGLIESMSVLNAKVAQMAAERVMRRLDNDPDYRYCDLRDGMADIESRLRDELGLVRLFVLNQAQSVYFLTGADLMGQEVADRLPSVIFEMEEAGRCLALDRPTASAFHSMRALEVAIRALAKLLEIPDPTKPAEKNWGVVLGAIKERIDAKYPAKARMPNTEGAEIEALYVTLDAIKNPWRNATMHTENVYQPHEASHIIQCVNVFLLRLSRLCDEDGNRA